jgi:replication initiation and membrane attachment protein DnaB
MLVETGAQELGIAIDKKMKYDDVRALIQLLTTFRHSVQQLFMDSPIIELLVSQINKQQVALLLEMLRGARKLTDENLVQAKSSHEIATVNRPDVPYGPFFPNLKKLTITSQSNQLEHLSRLLSYGPARLASISYTKQRTWTSFASKYVLAVDGVTSDIHGYSDMSLDFANGPKRNR